MNVVPHTQPEQVLEDQLVARLVVVNCAKTAVTDEASMLEDVDFELELIHRDISNRITRPL